MLPDNKQYPFAELVTGLMSVGDDEKTILAAIAAQPNAGDKLKEFLDGDLYVFTRNIPGSLPEIDPYYAASLDSAKAIMVGEAEDYADGLGYDDDEDPVAKAKDIIRIVQEGVEAFPAIGGHVIADGYAYELKVIPAKQALSDYGINPDSLSKALDFCLNASSRVATLLTQGADPGSIAESFPMLDAGNILLFEMSKYPTGLDPEASDKFYFTSMDEATDFLIDSARDDHKAMLEQNRKDVLADHADPYSKEDLALMSDDLEYVEDLARASREARKDDGFRFDEEIFTGRANGYDYVVTAVFPFRNMQKTAPAPGE